MKIRFLAAMIFGEAAISPLLANMSLIDEIAPLHPGRGRAEAV